MSTRVKKSTGKTKQHSAATKADVPSLKKKPEPAKQPEQATPKPIDRKAKPGDQGQGPASRPGLERGGHAPKINTGTDIQP